MSNHMYFVIAAYAFAALALGALCIDSYLRWRRVRAEYRKLFDRKDKTDA